MMNRYVVVKCPLEQAPSAGSHFTGQCLRDAGYTLLGIDRDGHQVWASPRILSERPNTLRSLLRDRGAA